MPRHNDYTDECTSDKEIYQRTGRHWNEWCDLIDNWTGQKRSFAAIADYLTERHHVRRLWSQAIAVYYRRQERTRQEA